MKPTTADVPNATRIAKSCAFNRFQKILFFFCIANCCESLSSKNCILQSAQFILHEIVSHVNDWNRILVSNQFSKDNGTLRPDLNWIRYFSVTDNTCAHESRQYCSVVVKTVSGVIQYWPLHRL